MNRSQSYRKAGSRLGLCLLLSLLLALPALAQQRAAVVNLAMLDGQDLTPDNIFNYTILSPMSSSVQATIKGRLVYRGNGLSMSYTSRYTLQPGLNLLRADLLQPQWTWSAPALRELFQDYRKLPVGTYEYCVEVQLSAPGGELIDGAGGSDCLYQKPNELFLINLVDPENNAKLHESFPVLSWMVNYPFASALTYRVRVAEVKEGQNNTAAVNRNNPWYQEGNLTGLSVSYPAYAKPLEHFQPYAWTVDAYYKGILLGGAEPWRFTIIDDSVMQAVPKELSHLDIRKESGGSQSFAVGKLKLKYVLEDMKKDTLQLRLMQGDKEIKLKTNMLAAVQGDNRYELVFYDSNPLQHFKQYTLELVNMKKEKFKVLFKYVNPDFLK